MTFGDATEWALAVIDEPWLVRHNLEDLNWDVKAVAKFVADYNKLLAEGLGRTALANRIKELLGRRRMVVEQQWREILNVPLYRFGAPDVVGAKVTYSEGMTFTRQSGWSIKVFGVGTGHTREMTVSNHKTFVAEKGRCKQVYVPVPMRVERIAVYDGTTLVGRGVRAEVEPPHNKKEVALTRRGCDTLPAGACRDHPIDAAEDFIDCALSGDKSGTVHEEEKRWSSDLSSDISLHLKKIVEVGPFVRITRLRELSLRFSLPAGHDYRGHLCRGRLWWESP